MPQTLRTNFSNKSHHLKPALRHTFDVSLSLQAFLNQLQRYVEVARQDLLQPRQSTLDFILSEARR